MLSHNESSGLGGPFLASVDDAVFMLFLLFFEVFEHGIEIVAELFCVGFPDFMQFVDIPVFHGYLPINSKGVQIVGMEKPSSPQILKIAR